jgi:hypothetical protein
MVYVVAYVVLMSALVGCRHAALQALVGNGPQAASRAAKKTGKTSTLRPDSSERHSGRIQHVAMPMLPHSGPNGSIIITGKMGLRGPFRQNRRNWLPPKRGR